MKAADRGKSRHWSHVNEYIGCDVLRNGFNGTVLDKWRQEGSGRMEPNIPMKVDVPEQKTAHTLSLLQQTVREGAMNSLNL